MSGLETEYDGSRPAGARLVAVRVGGKPLDPDARYAIGTLEMLVEGGDSYAQFGDAESVMLFDAAFADVLLEAFRTAEVVAVPEGGRHRVRTGEQGRP